MTRAAANFSFPRASRLGGRHAYAPVFAHKCSAAGVFVQVYAKPNCQRGARLGITVNKRLVPQATARNYCKRLTREAFRTVQVALGGTDLVVRIRRPLSSAVAVKARAEIVALLQRARGMCEDRVNVLPPR